MLVCSIISFGVSIYLHPQALLERTMQQDGLHDLCFGKETDDDEELSDSEEDCSDSGFMTFEEHSSIRTDIGSTKYRSSDRLTGHN